MSLFLYSYWRSSAAFRVRIALGLKGLEHTIVPVNIAPGVDEQHGEAYRAINPQGRVPALRTPDGLILQSMAILEWLEETFPQPALLPAEAMARARVRAFADTIACDIHPLNNLSVLERLREQFAAQDAQINEWYAHWIVRGFDVLEAEAAARPTAFFAGEAPGLAEIVLVPQMWNARRYRIDLSAFPALVDLDARAMALAAFRHAAPEAQPDRPG